MERVGIREEIKEGQRKTSLWMRNANLKEIRRRKSKKLTQENHQGPW